MKTRVVVIGGGTGTFVTLSALKYLQRDDLDISAIVTVADSGGSTGRLRDEFGFLPVGDLRQALAAMANSHEQNWIRELLLYRFSKGSGLGGHNLGNLILTALQDLTGSTAKAVDIASKIFRLNGHIYPVTSSNIQLVIEYQDGTIEIGEHLLDDDKKHGGDKIIAIKTSPRAIIYPQAREAIERANYVIIGPGDLFGSILPNLIVGGVAVAIKKSNAKFIYVVNLMTRYTQTHNMTAQDHVQTVERYLGRELDIVIINEAPIPPAVLARYRQQHEQPVMDDMNNNSHQVLRMKLLTTAKVKYQQGDSIHRSYLRHDFIKLVPLLRRILT